LGKEKQKSIITGSKGKVTPGGRSGTNLSHKIELGLKQSQNRWRRNWEKGKSRFQKKRTN
jgi:hypothetical protein